MHLLCSLICLHYQHGFCQWDMSFFGLTALIYNTWQETLRVGKMGKSSCYDTWPIARDFLQLPTMCLAYPLINSSDPCDWSYYGMCEGLFLLRKERPLTYLTCQKVSSTSFQSFDRALHRLVQEEPYIFHISVFLSQLLALNTVVLKVRTCVCFLHGMDILFPTSFVCSRERWMKRRVRDRVIVNCQHCWCSGSVLLWLTGLCSGTGKGEFCSRNDIMFTRILKGLGHLNRIFGKIIISVNYLLCCKPPV